MQCPSNAFRYNTTQCACNPGYVFNTSTRSCQFFSEMNSVELQSGVDYSIRFPATIFNFNSIKKFTQSQAVFLEATLVTLLTWLFFCLVVRFVGPLHDGHSLWFKVRWWISRLDVCFATRHWLDDQKPVIKRKTELGGTFSIASWILFIGLFAALLYQIISKRSVEVHNVRATNAPDLASFLNDMEFHITTISSMSCSHLRGLGMLAAGSPGLIEFRVSPLSTFADYSCQNTTRGPSIVLKCKNCQFIQDSVYVSWQFVDLPNDPATAVGFQFNLTAMNHDNKKHLSSVSGILKNGGNHDRRAITFRGAQSNVLKFNMFPRIYHNLHDLKLIQPLFHEFLPGSSFSETSQLQASLESTNDGLINTTLHVNFLSAYIVEIDNQNIQGPVSFLADLGGLYCICIGIFFYLLVQCEYRIKKLRHEDIVMRKIQNHRKAQQHWDKLRKYVMFTWGSSSLNENYNNVGNEVCCTGITVQSYDKSRSSHKRRHQSGMDTISFNRKVSLPSKQKGIPERTEALVSKHCSPEPSSYQEKGSEILLGDPEHMVSENVRDKKHEYAMGSHLGMHAWPEKYPLADDLTLQQPPLLESKAADEITIAGLQKILQNLNNDNVILREKLVAAQLMLHALSKKNSSSSPRSQS